LKKLKSDFLSDPESNPIFFSNTDEFINNEKSLLVCQVQGSTFQRWWELSKNAKFADRQSSRQQAADQTSERHK
jgi:hypothetical protein